MPRVGALTAAAAVGLDAGGQARLIVLRRCYLRWSLSGTVLIVGTGVCDGGRVLLTSYEALVAYYSEALGFGEALRVAGYETTAQAIDDAIRGATSGEILTYLALALSQFLADEPEAPDALRLEADRLLALADQALRAMGQLTPERPPRSASQPAVTTRGRPLNRNTIVTSDNERPSEKRAQPEREARP